MNHTVLNVGVLGCGDIARKAYIANINERFNNLRVYAVSDLVTERAQELAQSCGVEHVMTPDELLMDSHIDIILNLTGLAGHYEWNRKALLAGKHVYTEKTLAATLKESVELIEIAQERHLVLATAPDTFLGPGLQACRRAIEEGTIGRVFSIRARRMYGGPEQWHPRPAGLYGAGAGPMMDVGPYDMTAMLFLLGAPAERVCAVGGRTFPRREGMQGSFPVACNTHYQCLLQTVQEQTVSYDLSWDVKHDGSRAAMTIFGTEGTIYFSDADGFATDATILRTDRQPLKMPYEGWKQMRGIGLAEMADAIMNHRDEPLCNAAFAVHMIECLNGMNASLETGNFYQIQHTAKIPDLLPTELFEKLTRPRTEE